MKVFDSETADDDRAVVRIIDHQRGSQWTHALLSIYLQMVYDGVESLFTTVVYRVPFEHPVQLFRLVHVGTSYC
jgi:hypothetical protein